MHSPSSALMKRHKEVAPKISHFSLSGLLVPGQLLALNRETRTLSLLSDGPYLVEVRLFSVNELRVIAPILEAFPHYCPYEVLLSHISSPIVTIASIDSCRKRLQEVQREGNWQQELRPIRRVLSSIRSKLHAFQLEISTVRERGCSLTNLTSQPFTAYED